MLTCGNPSPPYVEAVLVKHCYSLFAGGMKNVTCVHAKAVPIVKIWDPELHLACDLNINNQVALKNTRMVRTYMQLDKRARPLAMIVKYWTRRRMINEGETLSPRCRSELMLTIKSIRWHTQLLYMDLARDKLFAN